MKTDLQKLTSQAAYPNYQALSSIIDHVLKHNMESTKDDTQHQPPASHVHTHAYLYVTAHTCAYTHKHHIKVEKIWSKLIQEFLYAQEVYWI